VWHRPPWSPARPSTTSTSTWARGGSTTGASWSASPAATSGRSSRARPWPGRPLDGGGNIDDNVLKLPAGTYRAISLRTYDPATDQWSIWWLDGRTPGRLDPPVVGGFKDGIGTFIAEDTFNDLPILVRFLWSDITATTCRWEQAFSTDGGETWEVNWIMESTRIA
jgi:hypothetical protein